MEMRTIKKSSNIRAVGFDPDPGECCLLGTMYVEFIARPGVIYQSKGVPVEFWNNIVEADISPTGSVGSYFARIIRPKHKFIVKTD